MTRSGRLSYATTRRYVDLAGERFRGEGDRLEHRLWGGPGEEAVEQPPIIRRLKRQRAARSRMGSGGGGI
jgi:hypothetical protein